MSTNTVYEWNTIPWKQVEKKVFKLQKRIYRAAQRGNQVEVRKLQRLLTKSHYATLLAVRRVSQDNQGKKTAGIDGVKSLTPRQRIQLVQRLKLDDKAKPIRRVYIPKPGKQEKRTLGIPVMEDRAKQALVKLALEPEWEAKFEPNSYGFRPARSAHDAISAIRKTIDRRCKFVLDTDIEQCFDKINHNALLDKLNCSPHLRRVIKSWLKSGVMDNGRLFPTEQGTPQGNVISPLLANVTLHGMETHIRKSFPVVKKLSDGKRMNPYAPMVIRYADDLVIIHPELKEVIKAKELLEEWLKQYGLKLKVEKTKIIHTLNSHEGQKSGFDFLGFNVRQYRASKGRGAKSPDGTPLGYSTLIKPSLDSIRRLKTKLKEIVVRNYSGGQANVIRLLNPIIRGWANYFRTENSAETFHQVDRAIFLMLWGWGLRRHRNKGKSWIYAKYWKRVDGALRFSEKENLLLQASRIGIRHHNKVQGIRSPFDGDWLYWSKRMSKAPKWAPREFKILKAQQGKCAMCKLYFKAGDLIEFDHKIPTRLGGKNEVNNLQALHRHCHDEKTTIDGSLAALCQQD